MCSGSFWHEMKAMLSQQSLELLLFMASQPNLFLVVGILTPVSHLLKLNRLLCNMPAF